MAKKAICAKCGAAIKHVHQFEGEVYGADCVLVVAGLNKWELRSAGSDVDSYIIRKAERAAKQKLADVEAEANKMTYTLENGWLIDYLEKHPSGFARSMVSFLQSNPFQKLSEKQKKVLLDLWVQPYKGIQEGYAMFEFVGATEGFEDEEYQEAQIAIASYATVGELKGILKENAVTGYSKYSRDELESEAYGYINI